MFDLPLSTTLLLLGFPAFWILYTVVFLVRTRSWRDVERRPERRP